MTQDDLIELLGSYEWRDVEFKEAQHAVPKSAYETVSAFANTEGGHLVFGVRENDGDVEIVGVLEMDKVQSDFLTTLRQREKISTVLPVREFLHQHEGADLLVFHVPEAGRHEKPVFLEGNIRRAFLRSGGSDVRLSNAERDRFLMDAALERYDGQVAEFDVESAFDEDGLRWYRSAYESRPENRSYRSLDNAAFLGEMGLLRDEGAGARPSKAAVLLFGTDRAFRQLLPRPVVDCQRFSAPRGRTEPSARWFDRLVLDRNLVHTWRTLIEDWYARFAEHPFGIDLQTLRRDDTPPDYLAFREAMINLLMHQDYADHGRHAEIARYPDQTLFRNPGDAFAPVSELLEPGEKETRNPRIVQAFRRIGLSENAGWGLRDVFGNWRALGRVPPRVTNDKRRKQFELALGIEPMTDRQQMFEKRLGVGLTDAEARALAMAWRADEVSVSQIRAAAGLTGEEAVATAGRLVTQRLLVSGGPGLFRLASHLRDEDGTLGHAGSDQVSAGPADLVSDPMTRSTVARAPVQPVTLDTASPENDPLRASEAHSGRLRGAAQYGGAS